jgi:peptidyl-prolyl cis-trans isomerase SurA
MLKKLFLVLFISGAVSGLYAQTKQNLDKLAAVVGDNIILKSEIERNLQPIIQENPSLRNSKDVRCTVLDQLITEKFLLIQAAIDSVTIQDGEVDQQMNQRLNALMQRNFGGDQEKLEKFLGKSLLEYKEELRPEFYNQQLAQEMQQKIVGKITITPSEVNRFFNALPADSVPLLSTEVQIGQIVKYPVFSEKAKKAVRDKLNDIRDRIRNGEKFETMAILYSQDPGSTNKGGDLGFQGRGTFVKQFEAVAYRLKPGEISQPVETEFGFHLIQSIERRGEQVHLRHILISPEYEQADLDSAKSKLDTIYKYLVQKKINFAVAAANYSDDDQTKINAGMISRDAIPLDQLSQAEQSKPSLFSVVDTMKQGNFTPPHLFEGGPQGTKKGYRIVYLKTKVLPHRASLLLDYPRIQNFALQAKQRKILQDWVNKKRASTYVRIDGEYTQCPLIKSWYKAAGL